MHLGDLAYPLRWFICNFALNMHLGDLSLAYTLRWFICDFALKSTTIYWLDQETNALYTHQHPPTWYPPPKAEKNHQTKTLPNLLIGNYCPK